MTGAEKQYLDAGMDAYVSKPIQPAQLFTKLADIADAMAGRPRATATGDAVKSARASAKQNDGQDILDLEKFAALEATLPIPAVCELLRLFIIDTDSHVGYIRDRSAAGDLEGVARNAHVIISTAGNIGAVQVSALAQQLVSACQANNGREVSALVERLVAANTTAIGAVRGWIENIAGADERAEAG
jgi:HPt (histidine-containing phosphotransfer) domain-containing protein